MAFATAHNNHAVPVVRFTVKNTFIDDAHHLDGDMSELPDQPSVLRCVTEPVPRHKYPEFELDDDGAASTAVGHSDSDAGSPNTIDTAPTQEVMPAWPRTISGHDLLIFFLEHADGEELEMEGRGDESPKVSGIAAPMQSTAPAWPRTMSGDDLAMFFAFGGNSPSTILSSRTPGATGTRVNSIAEQSAGGMQSELALKVQQALMEQREFPCTRVTSCTLMPLAPRSAKTKRTAPSDVTHCLRVCVEGLPAMKRNKWMQPLALEVAGVLERMECRAMVRRGELFAAGVTAGGEMVFVDFCAPRKSVRD